MKKLLKKINNFRISEMDLLFFYLFLATCTLSIRKVMNFYPLKGAFNEYTGIYIYLSDIFLALALFSWLIKLCYESQLLSSFKFSSSCFTWNNIIKKNVPHETISTIQKTYKQVIHNYVEFFPLLMGFFALVSNLWVTNTAIGLFRTLKLFEFIFLFYYIIFRFIPRGTNGNFFSNDSSLSNKNTCECSMWNNFQMPIYIFIAAGFINSLVAILQFATQHSLGLLWLKESLISKSIPGVAKIILNDTTFIRAYGLFPHPNILGGYLMVSILLTIFILFHVEQNKTSISVNNVSRGTYAVFSVLITQIIALVLSFSKSAIIGLILGAAYIYLVPRGTSYGKKISLKKNSVIKILTFCILAIFVTIKTLKPILYVLFIKSLYERIFYIKASIAIIAEHSLFGLGVGQFIFSLINIKNIEIWQLQPVHNVFLLILNELGIFVLIGFLYFIYKLFHVEQTDNSCLTYSAFPVVITRGVVLGLCFIMLFDHYLWDIQQGQIILWLSFGFLTALSYNSRAAYGNEYKHQIKSSKH